VLTGWYTDEDKKTTIVNRSGGSLFSQPLGSLSGMPIEVSYLKFTTIDPADKSNGADKPIETVSVISAEKKAVGIVAALAENVRFVEVTVTGTVAVSNDPADPNGLKEVYAGGIVGIAATKTEFQGCNARASVSVTLTTSTKNGYVGGVAGELQGTVTGSTVAGASTYTYPVIKSIISGGTGSAYAGGVAGKLTGTITRVNVYPWRSTVVNAAVTATATAAGSAYGGGFAGIVETTGTIEGNTPPLDDYNRPVTSTITVEVSATEKAYAGGLAGESKKSLTNNQLAGTITVTSKYYSDSSYAGGLVGKLTAGDISGSSVSGTVTVQAHSQDPASVSPGKAYAGGLAGYSDVGCKVDKSSFSSSSSYSGGIRAGFSLSSSYPQVLIVVTAQEAYAGGIVGYAEGTITGVYANATVNESDPSTTEPAGVDARVSETDGIAAAGGIAGKNQAAISKSYAVVTVKARAGAATTAGTGASAGGISGISEGTIENTFALARIDARPKDWLVPNSFSQAGGIVGYLDTASGSVKTSYAAGSVMAVASSATASAGGIVGYIGNSSATVTKCVAIQRSVASDGTSHNRVVGFLGGTITNNYAYEHMMSQNGGNIFPIITPNADDENGAQVTAGDAQSPNFYTDSSGSLQWGSAVWTGPTSSSTFPYPTLINPPLPSPFSFPSWAKIP
jgi:hypothetical protein